MGVCLVATTLTDDKIRQLLANPPLIWRVLEPDDRQIYLDAIKHAKPSGILAKLLGKNSESPTEIPSFTFSAYERYDVDLDKSWDGLNFCLQQCVATRNAPNFFADGREIGNIEVGYGPALSLTGAEIAQIADAYDAVSDAELLAGFIPARMGKVYPGGLWRDKNDTTREYLLENFKLLKGFLALAKTHGLGVLVQFT